MKILTKASADITPGADDAESPFGTFNVILSTPAVDRDGETLSPKEWKKPLPKKITFDADHTMSVAGTVGSGVPTIEKETGNLVVKGTYASIPSAQNVRALVNEGHIQYTSVAFLSDTITDEKGKEKTTRELLNGAFVVVPANPEAVVLSSKNLDLVEKNKVIDLIKQSEKALSQAREMLDLIEQSSDEPDQKNDSLNAVNPPPSKDESPSTAVDSPPDDELRIASELRAQCLQLQASAFSYEME